MTLRAYKAVKFRADRLEMIDRANAIISEYQSKGMPMTVRQLYYQFVARGLIENTGKSYGILQSAINDGRLAGLVSWTAIEDRTRGVYGETYFDGPAHVLRSAAAGYKLDKWADQEWRPEVWVEKEALVGVVGAVCEELGVDYLACRGYYSQSAQWRAGQRMAKRIQNGQRPIVFHLGDHDPSGIDMTRDNAERLEMFVGVPVMVARLALNMDQVEQYNPPPNPAKLSDARAEGYMEQFGDESWELDALPPDVLVTLIRDAVLKLRDEAKWSEALARETEDRAYLEELIEEAGGAAGEGGDDADA